MRLENTPEGRVVSSLSLRAEEQMKIKMRERRREMWNKRVVSLSRLSKTPEGREERLLKLSEMESYVKVCEDGMKKKRRGKKDCVGQRRCQKEVWSDSCCQERM